MYYDSLVGLQGESLVIIYSSILCILTPINLYLYIIKFTSSAFSRLQCFIRSVFVELSLYYYVSVFRYLLIYCSYKSKGDHFVNCIFYINKMFQCSGACVLVYEFLFSLCMYFINSRNTGFRYYFWYQSDLYHYILRVLGGRLQ